MLRRLPPILALTLVWVALWGVLSPKIVLGGLLVATLVTVLFPTPLLDRLPVRPLPQLRLIGFLLVDMVHSGISVAWQTIRYGPRARAGILAVPLLTSSGRIATLVAAGLALTPRSYVLQFDTRRNVLYVYVLGLTSPEDAETAREQVLTLQRRVIAAFGHKTEVESIRRPRSEHTLPEQPDEPS